MYLGWHVNIDISYYHLFSVNIGIIANNSHWSPKSIFIILRPQPKIVTASMESHWQQSGALWFPALWPFSYIILHVYINTLSNHHSSTWIHELGEREKNNNSFIFNNSSYWEFSEPLSKVSVIITTLQIGEWGLGWEGRGRVKSDLPKVTELVSAEAWIQTQTQEVWYTA